MMNHLFPKKEQVVFEFKKMSFSQKNNIEFNFIQNFYALQICNLFKELQKSVNKIEKNIHAIDKLKSNLQVDYLKHFFEKDLERHLLINSLDWPSSETTIEKLIIRIQEAIDCEDLSLFYEIDNLALIDCEVIKSFVCGIIIDAVKFIFINSNPSKINILLFIDKKRILCQLECDKKIEVTNLDKRFSNSFRNFSSRINFLGGSIFKPSFENDFSSVRFYLPNKNYL